MKLLGSILIIFASIISSYFYEKKLKEDIKNSEALYDLIRYIKNKIEYFSISVDDILKSYPNDDEFIRDLIYQKEQFNFNFLEKNIANDIKVFFGKLGKGFKREQLSLCDYTLKVLEAERDKMKKEISKKAKAFHALSLFFGIGCVIFLI